MTGTKTPTARVVSATPGRVRLKLTGVLRAGGETEQLGEALRARAELVEVRTNPHAGSVVIRYDADRSSFDDVLGWLANAGLTILTGVIPSSGALDRSARSKFTGTLNRWVATATRGGDLRLLAPIGLGALSLRQALSDVPGLRQAPWYVLAWYAFDSFEKLHRPGLIAEPVRASEHGGGGSTPRTAE